MSREGYKMTELGEIPEGWEMKRIKDISKINELSLSNSTSPEYEFRYLDLSAVKNGIVQMPCEKISFSSAPSRARRIIRKGDVIVATVRPSLLGNCYASFDVNDVICSTGFAVITPSADHNGNYLYQYLYSQVMQSQINKIIVGSNYPAINSSDVENLKLAVPPLPEQQKIASILGTVDEKIENIDAQISKTQELKKGLMQQLLTKGIGHTKFKSSELGDIPDSWEVVVLSNYAVSFAGGTPLRSKKEYYENGTIPWVKSGEVNQMNILKTREHITEEAIKDSSAKLIKVNSVLVALYGATAGNVGMLRIEAASNQAVLAISAKTDDIVNNFIYHYLKLVTRKLMSLTQGSGQPNLSKRIIDSLKIPLPKKSEQQKIAAILSTVDEKITSLQTKKQTYKQLKKGLMQQLLTGNIRVQSSQSEPSLA